MNPYLLMAEVDTFQVAIIVLAVIFSFLKWLWEQWTGGKTPVSEELKESDANEEINRRIREQARRRAQSPALPPPIPSSPPPVATAPWEEIRKAWREIRENSQTQKQKAPVSRAASAESVSRPQTAEKPLSASNSPAAIQTTVPASEPINTAPSMLNSLRALRDDPIAIRRAIVVGEILGSPKALQS
jgi:type IV secretory pathway VirB10-like protein